MFYLLIPFEYHVMMAHSTSISWLRLLSVFIDWLRVREGLNVSFSKVFQYSSKSYLHQHHHQYVMLSYFHFDAQPSWHGSIQNVKFITNICTCIHIVYLETSKPNLIFTYHRIMSKKQMHTHLVCVRFNLNICICMLMWHLVNMWGSVYQCTIALCMEQKNWKLTVELCFGFLSFKDLNR